MASIDTRPPSFWAGLGRLFRGAFRDGLHNLMALLRSFQAFLEHWLFDWPKATYGIAVTRMAFSVAALGILATNFSTRYYAFGSGSAWNGEIAAPVSDFPKIWLFSLYQTARDNDFWFTVLYLVLAVLAVLLLLGYRTRVVMPVFFVMWISFIELNDGLGDQGDNIFRIVLIVLMFADTSSRWSLDARRRRDPRAITSKNVFIRGFYGGPVLASWLRNLLHNIAVIILICQVSMVYVSGAFYKASGTPWADGTALYAPITTEQFGTWPGLSEFFTTWGPMVAGLSYMTVLIQAFFPAMLLNKWTRRLALLVIVTFHLGIAVLMGLPWFSLCMIGIDSILIRDVTWRSMSDWVVRTYRGRGTAPAPSALAEKKTIPSAQAPLAEGAAAGNA